MAVTYSGGYKITGVVRHGELAAAGPQTIFLETYENGQPVEKDLNQYFDRAFTSYTLVSGSTGGASLIAQGAIVGTATGAMNAYTFEFVVRGEDGNGSQEITFIYEVTPVHGMEQDYEVDYDTYTAIFSPKWTEGRPLETISAGGNPGDAPYAFNEQLILDGPLPGPQDDYIWSGSLPSGLSISQDGLVTGSLSAAEDTDFGTFLITVTDTHGASATLQLKVMVYVLS